MKKTLWAMNLLVIVFAVSLYAKSDSQDVVYLKNGSVIRGTIVEQVPNKYIKLKTSDDSIWVFQMDEIEKFTKEESSSTKTSQPSTRAKGYFNHERIGIITGAGEAIFAVGSINGSRINDNFALGLGVEFNNYPAVDLFPVFAHFRFNYSSFPITPVSFIDIGYSFDSTGNNGDGFFFSVGSGIELLLNDNLALNFDLSWRKQWTVKKQSYWSGWYRSSSFDNVELDYLTVMMGITF